MPKALPGSKRELKPIVEARQQSTPPEFEEICGVCGN